MRLQLTTRRLMVAVAVVAVPCARSVHFRGLARHHELQQRKLGLNDLELYLLLTPAPPGGILHPDSGYPILETADAVRAFAAYHKALEEKYYRAASHPWLFVESDPPPPGLSEKQVKSFRDFLDEQ